MKRFFYLLIVFSQTLIIHGQRGYYVKDSSSITTGVKLIDAGAIQNAMQCQVEENDQTLIFLPDEVLEYGFNDGRIYLSKIIKIDNEEKKVFLERLCKGSINLYLYKDKNGSKFFLEKDNEQLVEILRNGNDNRTYKDLLEFYVQDCVNVAEALKLVKYNKLSLSKFINQYNTCSNRHFNTVRFGLSFGYGRSKPVNSKNYNDVFKTDNSINIGFDMDIPVLLSNFSIHPEIYYQKNAYSSHSVHGKNIIFDIDINTTSINTPILLRYTYHSLRNNPYFNIGCILTYNIRNNNSFYSSKITDNIVEIDEINVNNIYSDEQIGYSLGGGIQRKIDYQKSVFIELRYNNLSGIAKGSFGNKSFQIKFGLTF
jgi:hypothetical protein